MKKRPVKKTAKKRSIATVKKTGGSNAGAASFPIVGIGASAGGLQASSLLLKNLPPNLGLAYVFVHHLSPGYDSQLTEILQRETAMPVLKVKDKMRIAPDHVYVIPPNTFMVITDGHLRLQPRPKGKVPKLSIDHFLLSLAAVSRQKAVGILLSGTSSDGTLGLKAIKQEGGITIVQDNTAIHPEMSEHAQLAGFADHVLPPDQIGKELEQLVKHLYSTLSDNGDPELNPADIKNILSVILNRYNVDFFSQYKRTTIYRRILRRMALNKVEHLDKYLKRLNRDQEEVSALYNDLLINVTSFFREPAFYKALEKNVFPQLVKGRKSTDTIRIWIPGCATGEEAYSTAISLSSFLQKKKLSIPVHIFSTDLDEKAIIKARQGGYPKSAVQHIPLAQLNKFFTPVNNHYQVIKPIREMCIFSVHNLLSDPPFSRIDLISCQNVLIYFEQGPQKKILQAFHYALKPAGFLLLGKSESIGNATELFKPLEKEARVYKRKNDNVAQRLDFSLRPDITPASFGKRQATPHSETDVEKESDRILLSRYVPASVLINKDMEILRFRGVTSAFLNPASGKASLNLLKMVREELIFELRGLLNQSMKTEIAVSKEDIYIDSTGQNVSIDIRPIKSAKAVYYLIVVREYYPKAATPVKGRDSKRAEAAKILKLEQALRDAREHIRTITDDFDTSREELQSANEEILSSNEELQSINEELETSKEEVQSANEELITINEELQIRIAELKRSHDYADAIGGTMRGPLIVLDFQMRIFTANKAFYQFFKMNRKETEGRFLFDLEDGGWDIPALREKLRDVMTKKVAFKDFEINHDFPLIGNRTMVVNAQKLTHTGAENDDTKIVIAFEDITRYRQAEKALLQTQEQLKLALEGGFVGTWQWNVHANEFTGSKEEAMLLGMGDKPFGVTGDKWIKHLHPEDRANVKRTLHRSVEENVPLDMEFRVVLPDGAVRWIMSKGNAYLDAGGHPEKVVGISIDITDRKKAIEVLQESERRFHHLIDNAPVMIWMSDSKMQTNFLNSTWLSFTGKPLEKQVGNGWYAGIHPDDSANFSKVYKDSFRLRKEFRIDFRLQRHDGEYRWMLAQCIPRYVDDSFTGYIGTAIDITERIDLEKQKDDFMGIASHELKTPVTSIKAYTQILKERFLKANDHDTAGMLGRLDNQIDKLTGLINTLLDVARLQSGQMDYDTEVFDVGDFVTEVAEELQRAFPHHTIALELEAAGKLSGDRARLAQVLSNLISNAVKYSPDADKVVVRTRHNDNGYVFTVEDFGIGINKEMQQHIFERFFRVSEAAGNRVSGLGLGLYVSAEIVRQHGGRIWLESEPGKGSRFSFFLPLQNTRS
ncbi:MAG TPA: CheR family methyltransferase [Ohtaekwangia sp.]|nr:CheR family methyltransferase [Ohtaekwangia sp.]